MGHTELGSRDQFCVREIFDLPVRRSFWESGTKEEKWRPMGVFRLFACYSTGVPNIGCRFQGALY